MRILAIALMILMSGTANAAESKEAAADVFQALQKGARGGNVPAPQKGTPTPEPLQAPRSAESEILKQFKFLSEKAHECMAAELGGVGVYDKKNCPKYGESLHAIIDYCSGKKVESRDQKACSQIRKEMEEACDDCE